MTFNINFPAQDPETSQLQLEPGEMLFVLGANGSGKSSLLFHFSLLNKQHVRRITAHRQTWMHFDSIDMTPASKTVTERQIRSQDSQPHSRYRDEMGAQRASMSIFDLVDAENARARAIAAAFDSGNSEELTRAAKLKSPLHVINEILRQSNLPISISIHANERMMASKNGGHQYNVAQLSDGERNALMIASDVLTAPHASLFLIDEPERHLHRAIISSLLSLLFEHRPDCAFVISTHDHDLPMQVHSARTLLLRSCDFDGETVQRWEADELPHENPIDDEIKRDLIGARRKILFVEGMESSLDKPLYSLIFPMVSVISKGNARDVERAVTGGRAGERFHWLRAFGIVDGDGIEPDQIEAKRENGIYGLPFYSVEAIYFHPRVINWIAIRQSGISGADADSLFRESLAAGVSAIADHTERLSQNVVKKATRKLIIDQIPDDDKLLEGEPLNVENNAPTIWSQRKSELDAAVESGDWETILLRCPVRESRALTNIAATLGFRKIQDYEIAVRHLLSADEEALTFVRDLFGNLFEKLND